jgi:pimeloyl-ACP methyl ester carboxylesterase
MFAKLDGVRIHYQGYRAGRDAAVFVHGWTCDHTFWRLQAPVYENRRSLLIDLPGHGESDKPETDYSQELFAGAVDAVMRDAGVDRAVLIGHSMGMAVGTQFLRMFPQKLSGFVIVDGFMPPSPKDDAERQKANAQREMMIQTWRSPDYKKAFVKMIDGMSSPEHTPQALRDEIRTKMTATPQHVVAGAMEGMFSMAPLGDSERFNVPTLAIMARRQNRAGYGDLLRKYFPKLEYQEWPGVGHFLMMEAPEKFNTALSGFLDKPRP